jgi:putative FmdB family regulatory protein
VLNAPAPTGIGRIALEDPALPLYDYRCEAGHKYELRQPFGSPSEHPCEKCGKPARRVLHARPLLFKGSGFYSTDSRGSSSRRSPSSSSSGSSAKSGSSSKSEGGKSEQRAEKSADLTSKSE